MTDPLEECGIVGDGVTDDTEALQRLVDRYGMPRALSLLARGYVRRYEAPHPLNLDDVLLGDLDLDWRLPDPAGSVEREDVPITSWAQLEPIGFITTFTFRHNDRVSFVGAERIESPPEKKSPPDLT